MSPGPAALTVDQPGGCRRIADAARQGVKPTSLEVNLATGEWTEGNCPILMEACPIKHIADADYPSAGELIIAANLSATRKARIVCRDFSKAESRLGAAKYPAHVGTDVTSGPSQWRRRRQYDGWSFPRHISCRSLTCSQPNRCSEQHQKVLSHYGLPFRAIGGRAAVMYKSAALSSPESTAPISFQSPMSPRSWPTFPSGIVTASWRQTNWPVNYHRVCRRQHNFSESDKRCRTKVPQ